MISASGKNLPKIMSRSSCDLECWVFDPYLGSKSLEWMDDPARAAMETPKMMKELIPPGQTWQQTCSTIKHHRITFNLNQPHININHKCGERTNEPSPILPNMGSNHQKLGIYHWAYEIKHNLHMGLSENMIQYPKIHWVIKSLSLQDGAPQL